MWGIKKRRRDDQHATRLYQPHKFLNRLVRIRNMLEDFSAQPNVKRVITFRNRPYVAAIGEVPVLVSLDRKAFFIANAVMPAEVLGAPTRRGVSRSAPCPRDQLPAP